MATPPTRVWFAAPSSGNYTTTTSPKTTTAVTTVTTGERVIVAASSEQAGTNASVTPSASAGSFTWSLKGSWTTGTTAQSGVWMWEGICTAGASSVTFSLARPNTGTTLWWGMSATGWSGVTATNLAVATSSSTSNSIAQATTASLADNSAVQMAFSDWNATSVATRTYQTVNGAAMTESLYVNGASHATAYGAYRTDVGTAGTKVVGLTTPSTLRWAMVALELVGTSTATLRPRNVRAANPAVTRSFTR